MIPVLICEKRAGGRLFSLLHRVLSLYGPVLAESGKTLSGEECADFFLSSMHGRENICLKNGVLLFEQGFHPEKPPKELEGITPVFAFDDFRAARFLKEKELPAVTFGVSARATLTVASNIRDRTELSLQRSLRTVQKETVEPCDFSVSHNGSLTLEDILPVSAVLLLCGIAPGYDLTKIRPAPERSGL